MLAFYNSAVMSLNPGEDIDFVLLFCCRIRALHAGCSSCLKSKMIQALDGHINSRSQLAAKNPTTVCLLYILYIYI